MLVRRSEFEAVGGTRAHFVEHDKEQGSKLMTSDRIACSLAGQVELAEHSRLGRDRRGLPPCAESSSTPRHHVAALTAASGGGCAYPGTAALNCQEP